MTAGSAETNGPMREVELGGTKPPAPPAPSRRRGRRLRRKSPPEVPVKGQLRMRSPSGAFVMVGISVVLVGMTIAVVGYWPHRGAGSSGAGAGNASVAGDMRREVAAGRHVPHSEKLKLIGPVIMGIGLFIFICANTMLYENRDMETRRLMQKGLYSMAAGLPEGTGPEDGHCQRGDGQPLPKANAECLLQQPAASPAASLLSLRSGAAARGAAPPDAPRLSRGGSVAPRGQDRDGGGHVVINVDGGCPGVELSLEAQLHTAGHSKSLDLGRPGVLLVAPIKDRKNRSWPRLDHVSLVGYAKLESTGESSDQLLEPSEPPSRGEPRPSSWVVGMERGERV
uniref:Transmembrane protein 200B n=1 Tax=Calidris pygmaea TaxID=425635 RepID=A0A8C3KAH2_9CHAR